MVEIYANFKNKTLFNNQNVKLDDGLFNITYIYESNKYSGGEAAVIGRFFYIPRNKITLVDIKQYIPSAGVPHMRGAIVFSQIDVMCEKFRNISYDIYSHIYAIWPAEMNLFMIKVCGGKIVNQLKKTPAILLKTCVDKLTGVIFSENEVIQSTCLTNILKSTLHFAASNIFFNYSARQNEHKCNGVNFAKKIKILFSDFKNSQLVETLTTHLIFFVLLVQKPLNFTNYTCNPLDMKTIFSAGNCGVESCSCLSCRVTKFKLDYIDQFPYLSIILSNTVTTINMLMAEMYAPKILKIGFTLNMADRYTKTVCIKNYFPTHTATLVDKGGCNYIKHFSETFTEPIITELQKCFAIYLPFVDKISFTSDLSTVHISTPCLIIYDYYTKLMDEINTIFININTFNYTFQLNLIITCTYTRYIHCTLYLTDATCSLSEESLVFFVKKYYNIDSNWFIPAGDGVCNKNAPDINSYNI